MIMFNASQHFAMHVSFRCFILWITKLSTDLKLSHLLRPDLIPMAS